MQLRGQTFGTLGYLSAKARKEPQIFDISMGDPDVEMKDDPLPLAKKLVEELFKSLIDQCSQRALDQLQEHSKSVLGKSNKHVKDLIEDHVEKLDYYKMIKTTSA